jgi:hypothetical protein
MAPSQVHANLGWVGEGAVGFANVGPSFAANAGPFDCTQGSAFGLGKSDDKLRRGEFPPREANCGLVGGPGLRRAAS